ncbi:chromosome transmission fidelity protein 18 homolog isoform X2 [Lates japonicus]|uniref:Chromosome transmission fidelity protein 18 homolog isoform X2 n=1 Tax=Lates japonicus TaxID=270547 RepID=A0AAD3NKM9_LATJO|nr:chromosome transmission fidelity protein 18 homolog isoform X2 [Lates japonicus]
MAGRLQLVARQMHVVGKQDCWFDAPSPDVPGGKRRGVPRLPVWRVEEVVGFQACPPSAGPCQAKQTISREMEQERDEEAEQLMLQRNLQCQRCVLGRNDAPNLRATWPSSDTGNCRHFVLSDIGGNLHIQTL